MSRVKFLLKQLQKYKFRYFFGMILVTIVSMLALVNPYLMKMIVDRIIKGGEKNLLIPVIIAILSVLIARALLRFTYLMIFEVVSQKIFHSLRVTCYKKMLALDFQYYDKHRTGDVMTTISSDLDFVRHFIAYILSTFLDNILLFGGAIYIMMKTTNVYFTMFAFVLAPLIAFLTIKMAYNMLPRYRQNREKRSRLNIVVQENISANRIVKAFVREDFEIEKLKFASEDFKSSQFATNQEFRKYAPFLSNANGLFTLYLILVGGIMVMKGILTLGDLVMMNGMIWMITGPLTQFGWLVNDAARCFASIDKVQEFLSLEPDIKDEIDAKPIEKIGGKFEFRNVSFKYEEKDVLKNISFSVEKGQKVAIVGPTGSSKTTIINLLCRFYNIDKGSIYIDDTDIDKIPLNVLRNDIISVQQDVFLFSDTIEANIAYGNLKATKEEIEQAAKTADAHDFIMKLPDQYNLIVGERGMGLSGGQKQRITLARALLKKPSVLILDDTTSSLDAKTEVFIQNKLKSYFKNKTIFIISQRISSVKDCDLILVLENGEIVERGVHEELLNNKGYYYRIYKHQFGEFQTSEGVSQDG